MSPSWADGISLGAIVSGFFIHNMFFIKGEWHIQAPLIFRFYIALFLLNLGVYYWIIEQRFEWCLTYTIFTLCFHLIGLFGSMFLYRVWFHPLKRFPGPFLAKVSKLWHVWKVRDSQNYLFLESLRQQYGDFVRTGPNEITTFHPDGLNAIHRTEYATRSGWYDLLYPSLSVATVRDPDLHDKRRRVWEPAFTVTAMKDHEEQIREHALKVISTIQESGGDEVNMNLVVYQFANNVMRDLAFSQSSDHNDQEWQRSVNTLHIGISILGPLTPAPWIAILASSFAFLPLVRDWNKLMSYCESKITERISMPAPERRDISAWLIENAEIRGATESSEEKRWLVGDAFAAILAGFDTTASTLIFAFFYLAKYPEYQARVYDEIKTADVKLSTLNSRDFQKLPFLNAFIDETLRLHHPQPSSGSKILRENGLTIGDTFIPGGVEVSAPRWSFGRQEAHYKRCWEFLPERWLNDSDLVNDRRAFTPWGIGKWSCLGKQVALFELRYLITAIIYNYIVSFPLGDDGSRVEKDYKDQVTAFPGQLSLNFHNRHSL
ncbi:putative benzoate 4-monooxygenase cytochrome P450 [Ustulina deusta]|nr:putative benzoate 4-monooxygenase cytochrome P450 [Ustulina deusta]